MKVSMEAKPWKNNSGAVFEVLGEKGKCFSPLRPKLLFQLFSGMLVSKLFGLS